MKRRNHETAESRQCAINMIQIVFLKLWWLTGQGPVRGEHVTSPDFVDPSSSHSIPRGLSLRADS